jgi:hypothetical protein
MGETKQLIPGRFDIPEVEHIDDMCFSHWPNLKRSEALRVIVMEHRLLTAAGILGRVGTSSKQKHCSPIGPLKVVDSTLGETGEGKQKLCTRRESA